MIWLGPFPADASLTSRANEGPCHGPWPWPIFVKVLANKQPKKGIFQHIPFFQSLFLAFMVTFWAKKFLQCDFLGQGSRPSRGDCDFLGRLSPSGCPGGPGGRGSLQIALSRQAFPKLQRVSSISWYSTTLSMSCAESFCAGTF